MHSLLSTGSWCMLLEHHHGKVLVDVAKTGMVILVRAEEAVSVKAGVVYDTPLSKLWAVGCMGETR